MFSPKPRMETAFRVLLIAVVCFNALIPSTVLAWSRLAPEEVFLLSSANATDLKQSNGLVAKLSKLFQSSLPDITPTVLPTETETPTQVPLKSPAPTFEDTITPIASSTSTLESIQTPPPSQIPISTQTPITSPSKLSIDFSAMPKNARIGDEVTFTLKIINDGQSPITGLHFSNFLPEGFNYRAGVNEGFNFDLQTQELTWLLKPEMTLLPGEKLVLEYTVVLTPSEIDDIQVIDTANIRANGVAEPIAVKTSLLISQQRNSLTSLDARGGKATGLDEHVQLKFPEKSLGAQRIISIRDLREQNASAAGEDEPWIVFELELSVPQVQDGQTSEETSATILQQAVTSVPTDKGPSLESDSLTPLMPVAVEFDEPVELIVSLDGMTDLATLGAEIQPFLVTLDEDSGIWVRIPLKTFDREANTITAELTHFSTWGVGLGSSFPQNGANVVLFESAYPSLFTGNSNYSIPIWTPPGRNGLQPDLTLSYSSGTANGVLGDIQAP